ncbi:MAG TPA: hypothetical protein VMU12_02460 [Candidatus Paceibacterota bacterium]|nr:hypothetical protein [Candidatus Paceibacterota bacterium]
MHVCFERVDAGDYDRVLFSIFCIVVILCLMCLFKSRIRAKQAFFAAQRRAQKAFETLGPGDTVTQQRVFEALDSWEQWQHRRVADLDGASPSETDWHALSLLMSLPPDDPAQYVM